MEYDFYFTKYEKVIGTFKGKVYTEKVIKNTAPQSKAEDLMHVGTGMLNNAQEFWRG